MTSLFIFTPRSLDVAIQELPDSSALLQTDPPRWTRDLVVSTTTGSLNFRIHQDDDERTRRIVFVISDNNIDPFSLRPAVLKKVLERAYQFSELASKQSVQLPFPWRQYKDRGFIAFFAAKRGVDPRGLRWISEVQRPSTDVCFWEIRSEDSVFDLANYEAPEELYYGAVAAWGDAFAVARSEFDKPGSEQRPGAGVFELEMPAMGSVVEGLNYEGWWPRLTPVQREFVECPPGRSVRVRGPSGSGKTLALEMKALHEVRRAQGEAKELRVLFATHSWAVAAQVDDDLHRLDPAAASTVHVYPLITMAHEVLPSDRWNAGLELLGDDSFSGKQEQIGRIRAIWADFVAGDWLTYRGEASEEFVARVESGEERDRDALIWDCLIEFACVIGADGIFPGINAESRYLGLPRAPWMMPLSGLGDKRAVLDVYERYMRELERDGLITNDQVINDLLNYLETYAWNIGRRVEGYDLIFVDELHLFDAQERLALQYLARDPSVYPKIFMALDPRQSPWEVFTDLAALRVDDDPSEHSDSGLGEVSSVDLREIHRFSPQILRLVQHLNHLFPALDLGDAWDDDFSDVLTKADPGPVPTVIRCGSRDAEMREVFERVGGRARRRNDGSTAVAVVDEQYFRSFQRFAEGVVDQHGRPIQIVASRDDVGIFRHSSPRLVLGPAEYLAGLQFDRVVVAGLPDIRSGIAHSGHQLRRFISLLYLAVSRAKVQVDIIVNDDDGGIPDVLERAAKAGVIQVGRGLDV